MKGAKNVSGLIDSRTQYGRPGASAPGQSGMCRHIFSHPDYDRRLWHLTRSADPGVLVDAGRSRACHIAWLTAGGELHPALKTYCLSCLSRLSGFYACLRRGEEYAYEEYGYRGLMAARVGRGSYDARGGWALGARGYDCGPEPSLRTSPSSSSSRPSAFPSDSLGRIDGAHHVCTTRAGRPTKQSPPTKNKGRASRAKRLPRPRQPNRTQTG